VRDRETPEMRERETRKRDMRQEREMWYLAERGLSRQEREMWYLAERDVVSCRERYLAERHDTRENSRSRDERWQTGEIADERHSRNE